MFLIVGGTPQMNHVFVIGEYRHSLTILIAGGRRGLTIFRIGGHLSCYGCRLHLLDYWIPMLKNSCSERCSPVAKLITSTLVFEVTLRQFTSMYCFIF